MSLQSLEYWWQVEWFYHFMCLGVFHSTLTSQVFVSFGPLLLLCLVPFSSWILVDPPHGFLLFYPRPKVFIKKYQCTMFLFWPINTDLFQGKKATAFPAMCNKLSDTSEAENRVVVDGNLITSRGPGTTMEFSLVIAEKLFGREKAIELAKTMLFVE